MRVLCMGGLRNVAAGKAGEGGVRRVLQQVRRSILVTLRGMEKNWRGRTAEIDLQMAADRYR
jgi:hypothetical protein